MDKDEPPIICKNCLRKGYSAIDASENESVRTKCTQWLGNCETCSDTTSITSSEYASASSLSLQQFSTHESEYLYDQKAWCSNIIDSLDKINEETEIGRQDGAIFGNVNIHKSRKIHVGNVTYITGPISFNQNASLKKKSSTTNTIFLQDLTNKIGKYRRKENTLVVHVNQTIHVKSKSWRKIFANCLFRFMELCMQLVDGA